MTVPKINMQSPLLRVTNIKNNTTAYWLKDVQIGDRVVFIQALRGPGHTSRGGSRAVKVTARNLTQHTERVWSLNMLDSVFRVIEVEEV